MTHFTAHGQADRVDRHQSFWASLELPSRLLPRVLAAVWVNGMKVGDNTGDVGSASRGRVYH